MTLGIDSLTEEEERAEYNFEPYFNTGRDFTLWQAARATSAAPLYFEPLQHHNVEYWDGGLYFNNPSYIAISEAELIWPSTKGKRPDLLLSVGNGFTPETQRRRAESAGTPRIAKRIKEGSQKIFGVLLPLRTLKKRLEKNMDSEAMWMDRYADLAVREPTRYVRLNPNVDRQLPQLDDLGALMEGGDLEQISNAYLGDPGNQKKIDGVFLTLVSTSFYFHPTKRSYDAHFCLLVVEGSFHSPSDQKTRTLCTGASSVLLLTSH